MNSTDEDDPSKQDDSNSSSPGLASVMAKAFLLSFSRTLLFFIYLGLFSSGFLSNPKGIDLFAGPLSLIGLWLLLFKFDLVIQAAKR